MYHNELVDRTVWMILAKMEDNNSSENVKNSQDDGNQSIIITHIENPNQFWFKYKSEMLTNRSVFELETKLESYAIDNLQKQNATFPSVGDIVLTLNFDWNKWIRAKVEEIDKNCGETTIIHLWAIDHGKPLTSIVRYVIPLNDELLLHAPVTNLYFGGLFGIVPAEFHFNLKTLSKELIQRDEWSQKAIDIFKDIIQHAKDLIFKFRCQLNKRYFGDLSLFLQNGLKSDTINDIFYRLDVAIYSENFVNDVKSISEEERENTAKTIENVEIISEQKDGLRLLENNSVDGSLDKFNFSENERSQEMQLSSEGQISNGLERCQLPLELTNTAFEKRSPKKCETTCCIDLKNSLKYVGKHSDDAQLKTKDKAFDRLLIHTDCTINSISNINDAFFFGASIRSYMSRYPQIFDAQSYAWPHLMRNNSLILIDAKSGHNTMAYLTALCALVQNTVDVDRETVTPKAVIFCKSFESVKNVASLCRNLLCIENNDSRVITLCTTYSMNSTITKLFAKQTDILITTPFCFILLWHSISNVLNKKDILYMCFDSIDLMQSISPFELNEIFEIFLTEPIDFLIAVTSQIWHPILRTICQLANNPLLIIGNETSYEASLYAESKMIIEFVKNDKKYFQIAEKLKYCLGSTVVICNTQNEVNKLSELLKLSAINHFKSGDIESENGMVHDWQVISSRNSNEDELLLLLCTDKILRTFSIRSARNIFHFSLPHCELIFFQRYMASFDNYTNIIADNRSYEAPYQTTTSTVFLDLDEVNNLKLPIFLSLWKRCEYIKIPIDLDITIRDVITLNENFAKSKKLLCDKLITNGIQCDIKCPNRHILIDKDKNLIGNLPRNGLVKLELLEVLSANCYSMRVLEYRPNASFKWKLRKCSTEAWLDFHERLNSYHSSQNGFLHFVNSVEIGNLYAVLFENEIFRCRIISKNSSDMFHALLIDYGITVKCDKSKLLQLHDDYLDYPSQAIVVFLVGIKPADLEMDWLKVATRNVDEWMNTIKFNQSFLDGSAYIEAEIAVALSGMLLVNDLKIIKKITGERQHRTEISIKNKLLKYCFAVKCSKGIDTINSMLQNREPETDAVSLPKITSDNVLDTSIPSSVLEALPFAANPYKIEDEAIDTTVDDSMNVDNIIESKCETLDHELFNNNGVDTTDIFIDRMNIDMIGIDIPLQILQANEDDIFNNHERLDNNYQELSNDIVINKDDLLIDFLCDILPQPIHPDIKAENANCVIGKENKCFLSEDYQELSRVFAGENFNCIQTDTKQVQLVKEIGIYDKFDVDDVQPVDLSAFYSANDFFLRKMNVQTESKHFKIYEEIDRYTENENNCKNIVQEPTIGQVCLVKNEGNYHRARVLKTFYKDKLVVSVMVFFCDSGLEYQCETNDIISIPDYLVDYTPFQAILCSMVGLSPMLLDEDAAEVINNIAYNELSKKLCNLYAKPINIHNEMNVSADNAYAINQYVILLHKINENHYVNINKLFIKRKWAKSNGTTKHLLDNSHLFTDENILVEPRMKKSKKIKIQTQNI